MTELTRCWTTGRCLDRHSRRQWIYRTFSKEILAVSLAFLRPRLCPRLVFNRLEVQRFDVDRRVDNRSGFTLVVP